MDRTIRRAGVRELIVAVLLGVVGAPLYAESAPIASSKRTEWRLDGKVIYRNGEPFFPFGIYYWSPYERQIPKRLEDLPTIAGAGLNMLLTPVFVRDRALLDKAEALGIAVTVNMDSSSPIKELLTAHGNHPAIGFLGVYDDIDQIVDGSVKYTPEAVALRAGTVKALAPHLLTYASGSYKERLPNYLGTTDLLAMQSYPVPDDAVWVVTEGEYRPVGRYAEEKGRSFIANLQTFPWNATSRMPTRGEVRNMTYQALMQGAQGILYYTFLNSTHDLNRHPDVIQELTLLSREVTTLKEILQFGVRREIRTRCNDWDMTVCKDETSVPVGSPWLKGYDLFVVEWTHKGERFLTLANANPKKIRKVLIKIGTSNEAKLINLFPHRAGGLEMSRGIVTGAIDPMDVHVYRIGASLKG